ncbi:MAG: octaprenyl-diphosphate synthase [Planctomycetota bacterium]|jgi:octaprenyl-diphosphate synthase
MSSVDSSLIDLLAPVEAGLEQMREHLARELQPKSASVSDMTTHIASFRGKQLRGALVLLCAQAHGHEHEDLPSVAAIVEMIHLATLVHDDVLDGAEVRRRVASVNVRWDNQTAVLLGDYLYARAFGFSTRLSSRLCSQVLSDTTQRICEGEIDQALGRYAFEATIEEYERIAGAKTAALYSAACELGARYPDGDAAQGKAMARYGWALGLAFQIVDDCLDVVGREEVVGKSVGNDVEDGKVTLPVLHVFTNSDEATRSQIRDAYTLPGLEKRAERLREVCDLEPGVSFAFGRAEELVRDARASLQALAPSPARESLDALGAFVVQRKF